MHDHGPVLVSWLLTAVCAGTGAYCLARLRHAGPAEHRQTSGLEGLMGVGMALMALPAGPVTGVPPEVSAATFTLVFAASAGWALTAPGTGVGHRARHLVDSAAMVYMALAMAPGATAGATPVVTGVLLLYFAAHALVGTRQLVPGPPSAVGPGRPGGATGRPGEVPEVQVACRTALALAMFAMLLTV